MDGEKLQTVKNGVKEVSESILSNSNNKIGIVTFGTESEIVLNLTNAKDDVLDKIDSLSASGSTNYYQALVNVDNVLKDYYAENNRDLIILFITDGYPNEDIPNEFGQYQLLKEKYPFINIVGIQYEMGKDVLDSILKISDLQYITNTDTLNDILFDVSSKAEFFDKVEIVDYINNDFKVESEDDIHPSIGTVKLEEENGKQKVTWTIPSETLRTGIKATLDIDVTLQEKAYDKEYVITNDKEKITVKLQNEDEEVQNTTIKPILKTKYDIIYDGNNPSDCSISKIPSKKSYTPFEKVTLEDNVSCNGYNFKGWKIPNEDVTMVNKKTFIMPDSDLTINGTWAKQSITKTMDGTVYEKPTLYKVLQKEATSGGLAKEYNGEHQDSIDASGTEKIYYWYGSNNTEGIKILDKNNVIFAGFCWQMIRTTDTGGVKMIYNGEAEDGKCLSTRKSHIGYASRTTQGLNQNYYYADSYTYDSTSKTFSLDGNKELTKWDEVTGPNLIGKYTCRSNDENGTCSTLYLIESYYSASYAYVIPLNSSSNYSTIGTLQFNDINNSLAYVGYMYNKTYPIKSRSLTQTDSVLSSDTLKTTYWYADDVVYGTPVARKYNLVDPYKVSTEDFPTLKGKYTLKYTSQTATNSYVYYIAAVDGSTMYYFSLYNNNSLDYYNTTYAFGDSYVDNKDGTYTINDATSFKKSDWLDNYNKLPNKYLCINAVDNTCSKMVYVISTTNKNFTYFTTEIKYSKSFTYEDGVYKLNDEDSVSFFDYKNSSNITKLANAHYTCFNKEGKCTTLSYIYYTYNSTPYYIDLTDGLSIEDALEEMLSSPDVNKNDSTVKFAIDKWYEKYLTNYSTYLEDTIFCNNRNLANFGGWNPNGGSVAVYGIFEDANTTKNLYCKNKTDSFSTQNDQAKLKYPIGLTTSQEMILLGNAYVKKTGAWYWNISPSGIQNASTSLTGIDDYGIFSGRTAGSPSGVRPTISLKPDTMYIDGDGSRDNPYIVETN